MGKENHGDALIKAIAGCMDAPEHDDGAGMDDAREAVAQAKLLIAALATANERAEKAEAVRDREIALTNQLLAERDELRAALRSEQVETERLRKLATKWEERCGRARTMRGLLMDARAMLVEACLTNSTALIYRIDLAVDAALADEPEVEP